MAKYRFRDAWRSLQKLRQDPDDTVAVFEIIEALSGPGIDKYFQRFRSTDVGRRVLAEKIDLLPILEDRVALRALPEGSLGREYFEWTAREELSADGLVEASESGSDRYEVLDEDRSRFSMRLRDSHDLEHVASGYGRDMHGEAALLALGLAQGWNHGIALIVAMAFFETDAGGRRLMRSAWQRGRRAATLFNSDWEGLLAKPLAEVREELRLGNPPAYDPVWSEGAPAAAV